MTNVNTQTGLDELLRVISDRLGLSDDEWDLILDGTMGESLYSEDTVRCIAEVVEDLELAYFHKWSVDRQSLLNKLSKLDSLSRLALVDHLDFLRA